MFPVPDPQPMHHHGRLPPSRLRLLTLWHGMTLGQLARWLAVPPSLAWNQAHRSLMLPLTAVGNSLLGGLERLVSGRRATSAAPLRPPLFIIGHLGSGTAQVQRLLAHDPQFQSPTWSQCFFPNHCLLTERWLPRWLLSRLMPLDPAAEAATPLAAPQEEFALAILTGLSPWRLLARPDDPERIRPLLDLSLLTPQERTRWKQTSQTFLKKIVGPGERRLVLNSPWSALRIPLLLELFPAAQFVYVLRAPGDDFRLSMTLWRRLVPEHSLGRPHQAGWENFVLSTQELTHQTYLRDRAMIPPGHLHELKFEDLQRDPLGELERLYSGLGLEGWDRRRGLEAVQATELRQSLTAPVEEAPLLSEVGWGRLWRLAEQQGYSLPDAPQVRAA